MKDKSTEDTLSEVIVGCCALIIRGSFYILVVYTCVRVLGHVGWW